MNNDRLNDGGPAFPFVIRNDSDDWKSGMTIRDWFAGMALQGMIASESDGNGMMPPYSKDNWYPLTAERAYQFADAMLKEREKNND